MMRAKRGAGVDAECHAPTSRAQLPAEASVRRILPRLTNDLAYRASVFVASMMLVLLGIAKTLAPESSAARILMWRATGVDAGRDLGDVVVRTVGAIEFVLAIAIIDRRTRRAACAAALVAIVVASVSMIAEPAAFALTCGCAGGLFDVDPWTHAVLTSLLAFSCWKALGPTSAVVGKPMA